MSSTLVTTYISNNSADEFVSDFNTKYGSGNSRSYMKVNYITDYTQVLVDAADELIQTNLSVQTPVKFGAIFEVGASDTLSLSTLCSQADVTFAPTRLYIFHFGDNATYSEVSLTLDGTGTIYTIRDGDKAILHHHSSEDSSIELDIIKAKPLVLSSSTLLVEYNNQDPLIPPTVSINLIPNTIYYPDDHDYDPTKELTIDVTTGENVGFYTLSATIGKLSFIEIFGFLTSTDFDSKIGTLNEELSKVYQRISTVKKMINNMDATFYNTVVASNANASGSIGAYYITLSSTQGDSFKHFTVESQITSPSSGIFDTDTLVSTVSSNGLLIGLSKPLLMTFANTIVQTVVSPTSNYYFAHLLSWDDQLYNFGSTNYNKYITDYPANGDGIYMPPCFDILNITMTSKIVTVHIFSGISLADLSLIVSDNDAAFTSPSTYTSNSNPTFTASHGVLYSISLNYSTVINTSYHIFLKLQHRSKLSIFSDVRMFTITSLLNN